jgi:hypothetical protein
MAAAGRGEAAASKSREDREAEARQACAEARLTEGIEILAALLAELGHPGYVYNQARCYLDNGHPEQAVQRFREYLRLAPEAPPEVRARVDRYIADLERVPASSQPATAPAPTPPLVAAAPAPPEPRVLRGWRTAAVALAGLGAVGLAGGLASSLELRSLEREVEDPRRADLTLEVLATQRRRADPYRRAELVTYGVGIAALAAAVGCLLVDAGKVGVSSELAGLGYRVHF